jgi:hypothetical protein
LTWEERPRTLRSGPEPTHRNSGRAEFRPCFTAPTFQTFLGLVVGLIAQTRRRTVCGKLTGAGLDQVRPHSRDHRFFTNARWSGDALGLALAATQAQGARRRRQVHRTARAAESPHARNRTHPPWQAPDHRSPSPGDGTARNRNRCAEIAAAPFSFAQ